MPTATVTDPRHGDLEICYDVAGSDSHPVVLLVPGLGMQLTGYRDDVVDALVERGHRVVRYDNRDVGLSTHLDHLGPADLARAHPTRPDVADYHLTDMARDAAHLLAALDVDRAHLVGVSMGGMIAQVIAIEHPERAASLTSIMSSPGPQVAPPTPEAATVLAPPPAAHADAVAEQAVAAARIIGSPAYPTPPDVIRRRARAAYERANDPLGVGRQLAAILCSPDRRDALGDVGVPTLVVHGDADPLIPLVGGEATAAAVPDARLEVIEGMGHDLPDQLTDRLIDLITTHVGAAAPSR